MVVASIGRKVFAWRAGAGKGKHGGKEGKKGGIGKGEGRGGTRGIGGSLPESVRTVRISFLEC